jgi:hypothetical protein
VLQEYVLARKVNICFADEKHDSPSVMLESFVRGFGATHINKELKTLTGGVVNRGPKRSSDSDFERSCLRSVRHFFARLAKMKKCFMADIDRIYPPEHILQIAYSTQAKDPRDKIYGILSCIPAHIARRIACDYSLSCAQVFAKATRT